MRAAEILYDTVDEIHCVYRHGSGQLRRRQLLKQIVSNRCGWVLILFAWQDWRTKGHVKTPGWQPIRFALERWHKVGHRWRKETRLSMNAADARTIVGLIGDVDVDALIAETDTRAA